MNYKQRFFDANGTREFVALAMASVALQVPFRTRERAMTVGVGFAMVAAAALGLFGRFSGLSNFPLAVDEYFFAQSVRAILEHGVPALDAGGYYTRGLLPQYLTAASVLLFGESGFAYRLPAALFSLGTVPLAYAYGKRLLGPAAGFCLAAILMLSAWEIEFGRFARMYSALQFFALLFFVAVDSALGPRGRRWAYAPHAVLVMAIVTHELAVLLVPFLLAFMVSFKARARDEGESPGLGFLVVTSVVAIACVYYSRFDPITLGVTNRLPPDYQTPQTSFLRLPLFPLFPMDREALFALYLGLAAALAALFALGRRLGTAFTESALLGSLLILSALFHQFLVAGLIVLVMVARQHVFGVGRDKRLSRLAIAVTIAIGVCWVGYALSSRQWVDATWRPDYRVFYALIRTFVGWPNLIDPVVVPWKEHLPLLGSFAAVALLHQLMTKGMTGVIRWTRNPAAILVPFLLAFAVLQQQYPSVRYSFLLYPFILLLVFLAAVEGAAVVVNRLKPQTWKSQTIGVAACVVMFASSSDFNLRQIIQVAGQDVRLRTGEFEGYGGIWYDRWDFESPATFVNKHANIRTGAKVIVVAQPPVSYYLRVPHGVYYDRLDQRFTNLSRSGGTVELWSNQPLLSTPRELSDYTNCATEVWIVRQKATDGDPFAIWQVWGERLERVSAVFRSVDHRLEVVQLALKPGSGC